jgi:hypothetical protein
MLAQYRGLFAIISLTACYLLDAVLTTALAVPARPPFGEDCQRIDYSTAVSGIPNPPGSTIIWFTTTTTDPEKPGVAYYWKCKEPKQTEYPDERDYYGYADYSKAYAYYRQYYSGTNVATGLALVSGQGGYNEFLNGTNVRTSTGSSSGLNPFGAVQAN